ncbi:hypothetical protein N7495_003919 [Penicillium taxi]|uniref:uncharacterized protein n=1 Tax=Penicillium taxi TaxID=168475 RepID=UPI0025457880|nr:uncharacterized protein N7495_003919 [Penicillium taxi]KAJ5899175.1 hypothetical protein N7495_003919 [Penicillium taxi]
MHIHLICTIIFDPDQVFSELYKQPLSEAFIDQSSVYSTSDSESTLASFIKLFNDLSFENPSADIRKTILEKLFRQYRGLYSATSCFFCLCRNPEHMMPCRHAICDNCTIIFGQPSRNAEYHFVIHQCPLYNQNLELTISQLPPMKRPVILSLDGGGIRGILQLGLLYGLEKRIGSRISLPQIFELSAGTSVGALNQMDFAFNKNSAEQSFEKFPQFAQEIFPSPRPSQAVSFANCERWMRWLTGVLTDGQYDEENLENILKKSLGSNRRIFDVGTTSGVGSRVAVITSRVSDGRACVIANYRGAGFRSAESAYQFLMPEAQDQNPFLWEVRKRSPDLVLYKMVVCVQIIPWLLP